MSPSRPRRLTAAVLTALVGAAVAAPAASAADWADYIDAQNFGDEAPVAAMSLSYDGGDASRLAVAPQPAAACQTPATRQAYARWGDYNDYYPAPGGTFEESAHGWTLGGGAAVVAGNDTTGVQSGSRSLRVGVGAVAISPPFCVDELQPHFRFSHRRLVRASDGYHDRSAHNVSVLYRDADGRIDAREFVSATQASDSRWLISGASPLGSAIDFGEFAERRVIVRLVLTAPAGAVQFDNVMVDPFRAR